MKIMIIGAHPADGIDLAGGTACLHAQRGDEVIGVTLTDGVYSHFIEKMDVRYEDPINQVKLTKRNEFRRAWEVLGVKELLNLGWRDEPLTIQQYKILALVEQIRYDKPDMVITHHPNEYAHWDHSECGKMICRALKAAMKLPGDKHWVKTVYFFGTQFRPEVARLGIVPQPHDVLIDISSVIDAKVEAMCYFESQGHNDPEKMWERMNSFEREVGRADGIRYSEGFISYYPLKRRLLPINEVGGFY